MKVSKVCQGIYHIGFEDQLQMAKSLIRFQEHYESPKFRGKVFTLGEYREWYSNEYGGFTYYKDWTGFNFPSHVLDNFRKGLFDPLSSEEREVLETIPASLEKFYVIATHSDSSDDDAFLHEVCHGFYYTNHKYRDKVNKALERYPAIEVGNALIDMGYHNDVIEDETHAYISVNSDILDKKGISYPKKLKDRLIRTREDFNITHLEYSIPEA